MRELEQAITEMEELADAAIATSDYEVPEGRITFVQRLGHELKGYIGYLQQAIDGELFEGGAQRKREAVAYWSVECRDLYIELRFTMADPAARRGGLGGMHASTDYAVEEAAHHGRRDRHHRRNIAPRGARARWDSEGRDALAEILDELAGRRDQAMGDLLLPSELWPLLFGRMDEEGFAPAEQCEAGHSTQKTCRKCSIASPYLPQSFTFGAFIERINKIRKVL